MRLSKTLPLTLAIALLGPGFTPALKAQPAAAGEAPMPTLAPMVKRISPSVVNIATRGTIREQGPRNPLLDDPFFRRFFDAPPDQGPRERQFQSAGSGVIVDAKNGYVLTNHHVIENADEIEVILEDNRNLKATVVGSDDGTDIAVLKLKDPGALTPIALGNSDQVQVGDFVVAIGNPFVNSSALSFAISVIGVLVFAGLTAWDTQRLKFMYYQLGGDSRAMAVGSTYGALSLYLDFINMFMFILRLMSPRN